MRRNARRLPALVLVVALASGGRAVGQSAVHAAAHRTISTSVPASQAAFDRGLIMLYAFNIGEAILQFGNAAKLDPQCAMAYWGQAIAEVTDINVTPDAAAERRGAEAVAKAEAASEASPAERELIAAAHRRFDTSVARPQRREGYATMMSAYSAAHPEDADGWVETAFAIWQSLEDVAVPAGHAIGADLDKAEALEPGNLGARHLRVHYWEEAGDPKRALPDADYLAQVVYDPGESHLPHMPGHIYLHVGDYARAAAGNLTALANDAAYFKQGNGPGQAYMRTYHDHDIANCVYALTTIGMNAQARRTVSGESPNLRSLVALRVHDWRGALDAGGEVHYVRGIAAARLGRLDMAQQEADAARASPMELALISAAIARSRNDAAEEIAQYAAAARARRKGYSDPPSRWAAPADESYGTALLRAGRANDAEAVFAAALKEFPNDPHLLFGLAEARKAQGLDDAEARNAYVQFWKGERPLILDNLG